jgi:hypothetical protein
MLLTKSSGVQVQGSRERLAATQKMERSMETAVTKIMAGQAGAPSAEFFTTIDAEMDVLIAELFDEKDGFQLQINNANANVATCNTNRQAKSSQLNATGSFKEDADLLKIDHGTCRVAELSAYNAKTASCDLLATKTQSISNAAPQCNCPLSDSDTSDVLTCLASNRNWVESHKTDLTTQKSDCDTKTQTWSSEAGRCDTLQSNYEGAVCIYDEKLEDMCSTLDTCYNQAILTRTSVVENVMIEEAHLKTMLASAKKIVCFLNILKQMDTQNFTMSDLEACKSLNVSTDTTYLNKSVLDVDITYSPADAKAACQTLSSTPGDGQWAAAEYAGYTTAWLRNTEVCPHKSTPTNTTEATTTTTEATTTTTEATQYCTPGGTSGPSFAQALDFTGAGVVPQSGFTITARIRTAQIHGEIIGWGSSTGSQCVEFRIVSGNLQYGEFHVPGGWNPVVASPDLNLNDDSYHDVAVIRQVDGSVKLYSDGVLVSEGNVPANVPTNLDVGPKAARVLKYKQDKVFNGVIGPLRIYATADESQVDPSTISAACQA